VEMPSCPPSDGLCQEKAEKGPAKVVMLHVRMVVTFSENGSKRSNKEGSVY